MMAAKRWAARRVAAPCVRRGQKVVVAALGYADHRLDRERAGDPDARVRDLARLRPHIDIAQRIMRSVMAERAVLGPGAVDEVDRFQIARAGPAAAGCRN